MNSVFQERGNTLDHILRTIQEPLIELVHSPHGAEIPVLSCMAVDGSEEVRPFENQSAPAVMLFGAIGEAAINYLGRLARFNPAVVFIKADTVDPEALAAFDFAIIRVDPATFWWQFFSVVNRIVQEGVARERHVTGSGAGLGEHNDLFGLAKTVGTMTGTLVSIDDDQSRVLAFSPLTDEADEIRRRSILGRSAPPGHLQELSRLRVFERLRRREGPIHLEERDDMKARLGTGIFDPSTDEYLGTIWAQQTTTDFTDETHEAIISAAEIAARLITYGRLIPSMQIEMVQQLLDPTTKSESNGLMSRLTVDEPSAFAVVGFEAEPGSDDSGWLGSSEAVAMLSLWAAGYRTGAMSAPVGGRLYAVLPGTVDLVTLSAWARKTVAALSSRQGIPVRAGIGWQQRVQRVRDVRNEIDRVFERTEFDVARPVLSFEEMRSLVLLEEALSRLRATTLLDDPRLQLLREYDRLHDTDLTATAQTFIAKMGDVTVTASAMHVHPNSVRYRLKRIEEISGYDLGDPDDRLVLDLQIRAGAPSARSNATTATARR